MLYLHPQAAKQTIHHSSLGLVDEFVDEVFISVQHANKRCERENVRYVVFFWWLLPAGKEACLACADLDGTFLHNRVSRKATCVTLSSISLQLIYACACRLPDRIGRVQLDQPRGAPLMKPRVVADVAPARGSTHDCHVLSPDANWPKSEPPSEKRATSAYSPIAERSTACRSSG